MGDGLHLNQIELDADLAQDLGRELITAVKIPNWDHATMLLDLGADVNYMDEQGWRPLTAVAEKGDFILVRKLLDRGANPNLPDKHGWTPLMKMAAQGEKEDLVITKILLDRGADPNFQAKNGQTALIIAIETNSIGIAKELLNRGVDRSIRDQNGKTAFDLAQQQPPTAGIREILELMSPDPSVVDPKTGISNLALAAGNDFEMLRAMVDKCQNIDQRDRDGNTPLIYAIANGKVKNVELLLDRGADPNLANNGGGTPLAYAIDFGQKEIEQMLIEAGAKNENRSAS